MKDLIPYYAPPFSSTNPLLKKKDSSLLIAFITVIALHLGFLFLISFSTSNNPPIKPKERLIVKTINLQPKSTQIVKKVNKTPSTPQEEIAYIPAPPLEQPQPSPFNPPPQPPPPTISPQPLNFPEPVQPPPPPEPVQPTPFFPPPQPKSPQTPPQPKKEAAPQENVIAEAAKPVKTALKKTQPKKVAVKAPDVTPHPKVKKANNPAPKKTDIAKNHVAPTAVPVKAKKEAVTQAKPKETPVPRVDPIAEAKKARQRELLSKAKESIAKITQNRDKVTSYSTSDIAEAYVPKAIESLEIDTLFLGDTVTLTTKEISYRDEIAHRLKLGLRLPDYGEVKIKLTLLRSGKVSQVQIVSSKNQKNKQYVEKTLPTLIFPSFGDNFKDADQYTFTICLNNEG